MVRPMSPGSEPGVQRLTTIMTAKASGTLQAAGWPSSEPTQPPGAIPAIVARIAPDAVAPPISKIGRAHV